MKLDYESILDHEQKVIGIIMRVTFAENPKRSKGGTGPNLMDYSTFGTKVLDDLGDGKRYKLGMNIYHAPD